MGSMGLVRRRAAATGQEGAILALAAFALAAVGVIIVALLAFVRATAVAGNTYTELARQNRAAEAAYNAAIREIIGDPLIPADSNTGRYVDGSSTCGPFTGAAYVFEGRQATVYCTPLPTEWRSTGRGLIRRVQLRVTVTTPAGTERTRLGARVKIIDMNPATGARPLPDRNSANSSGNSPIVVEAFDACTQPIDRSPCLVP